ncbi:putative major facilitator superfamily protein [Botrytis fragariae]|uniref:Putative major facilitator superfamily protein n=1 Tax=Botrytis fragariae TaxID=1964551 RepID=A0A8H6ATX9_9HELO|nr:putative major facilitator superfamily protein [Botrytis fragariae]KAF5873728.1 putative major facilitator superfamily protein [Botrytis fragariae]
MVASTVSILIALTWAGSLYAWQSLRVIVPLIPELFGLVGFFWVEISGGQESLPRPLFRNRTSITIYTNAFIISMLNYWIFFFLSLYFQAVLLSTPTRSGVQILPITLLAIPGAAIGALALSKWGKYKHLHIIDFALLAAGIVGAGMVLDTLLPAVQAGVAEADSAAVTSSWSFERSFRNIWGVAIPGVVLNIYSTRATREFIKSFSEITRSQIIGGSEKALGKFFLIGMVFPILAFLLSFLEREVKLRKVLETEVGLEERMKGKRGGK